MMQPFEQDPDAPPINPLPPVVVALALVIFGVELIFQTGNAGLVGGPAATGWRLAALEKYGFYDPVFDWMVENRVMRWDYLARFITYPFVHGSFTQMAFALVFVLSLGKMVGEVFSGWAVLVIFFAASIVGALAYGLVFDTRIMLFGAFPAAYGLIGAYTWLLWTRAVVTGESRAQAFTLIGFLMGVQLIWGVLFGGSPVWLADVAGFAAGFALSFVLAPGGWRHIVARLRRR